MSWKRLIIATRAVVVTVTWVRQPTSFRTTESETHFNSEMTGTLTFSRAVLVLVLVLNRALSADAFSIGVGRTNPTCYTVYAATGRSFASGIPSLQLSLSSSESDETEPQDNESTVSPESTSANAPSSPPPPPRPAATPGRKKIDPLLASLTRMDEETINAPRMQVPLWGELILDKSLFIFLPIAAFAIIGVLTSIYVALNSGDAFVDAMASSELVKSLSTPPSATTAEVEGCRGLCSSQEQDLEGLKVFMNSLRKN